MQNPVVRRAFTLTEILVVVAIVALLSALLFPTFQMARSKARNTACLSNLRQLGMAINLYTQDYDSLYPNACDTKQRYSYLYEPDRADKARLKTMPVLKAVLAPYTKNEAIWQCPSDQGFPTMYGWYDQRGEDVELSACDNAFDTYGTSYLYNIALTFKDVPAPAASGYTNENDPSGTRVGSAETGILTDAAGTWHTAKEAAHPFLNLLFADGHCKAADDKTFVKGWLLNF